MGQSSSWLALVLFLSLAFSGCLGGKPPYADDSSPVMYFYSAQCHYCEQEKPVLEQLAAEGYRVRLMDVGEHEDYWTAYSLSGTPTFIAADGEQLVGFKQVDRLREWLGSKGARLKMR